MTGNISSWGPLNHHPVFSSSFSTQPYQALVNSFPGKGIIPTTPSIEECRTWCDRSITCMRDITGQLENRIKHFVTQLPTFCALEAKLDSMLPNFAFQIKIDNMIAYVEKKFAPLKEFNDWINSNGNEEWFKQVGTFLAKLPLRAARNVLNLLYQVVKALIYSATHPLKATLRAAEMLIQLTKELAKPEVWSKIGAGMIGASCGNAVITGNPLSAIGVGIGAALLIAGLSAASLKAAIEAKEGQKLDAVGEYLLSQIQQLPESALTGFFMGIIMGKIQSATHRVTSQQDAENYAKAFIKKHHLPKYSNVELDPSGKISISWNNYKAEDLFRYRPELEKSYYQHTNGYYHYATKARIDLTPDNSQLVAHYKGHYGYDIHKTSSVTRSSLEDLGLKGRHYPMPETSSVISAAGGAASLSEI